jgi:hypothetical protein
MEWLAFAILAVGVTYFAIHYRGFRRGLLFTLLGIVVLAAIGGVVAYFYSKHEDEKHRIAGQLIKPDQVEIADAALSLDDITSQVSVTNKSPFLLKDLALRVTVLDCPSNVFDKFDPQMPSGLAGTKGDLLPAKPAGKCTAVGEDVAKEYGLNIPSGQKRAFKRYVSFRNLPPLKPKEWSWHYSIVEVVAD